jgi:hypothetical protein
MAYESGRKRHPPRELVKFGGATAEHGPCYATGHPDATTISGIHRMRVLDQNLRVAVNFQPLDVSQRQSLRDQCRLAPQMAIWNCSR